MKTLFLGRVSASLLASLSAVFVYLSLKKISKTRFWAGVFTLFYALGTTTFSVSSRGLWQHTSSELLISALVFFLIKNSSSYLIGLVAGLAVLARPTDIVLAVAVLLYVYFFKKKDFLKFFLGALPCALFFLIYNYAVFGFFFMEGYGARGDFNWSTPLYIGLLGFLFSPARSFLFVSPPLVLSYYGIVKVFKDNKFGGKFNIVLKFLSAGFVLSVLLFSKWYTWHGGNGFGYRMLTDFLPIVMLLAYLVFINFSRVAKWGVIVFMLYSVYVQFNAVNNHYSRCGSNHNWDFYCLK